MREYKIVVAGNGGVGKSALTVQFVQGLFVTSYDATIEDSYRKHVNIDGEDCRLEILDTAGTEQFSGMRDLYVRNGQGFILVYSINDPSSFTEIDEMRSLIVRMKGTKNVPMVLVGNKSDLHQERRVPYQAGRDLARQYECSFFETSAKYNHNVAEIFFDSVRQINVADPSTTKKKKKTLRTNKKTSPKEEISPGRSKKNIDEGNSCCSIM